ncbi:MAG: DUF4198 domain-containing protein [Bacteroidota bacterium]
MKKLLLFLAVVALSVFAIAHEFWLLPQKFFYTIRETAIIRFKVGEHFLGENWKGSRENIQQLLYYPPSGEVIDMSAGLSPSQGDSVRIPLKEEGTHMLVFNSTNLSINLEPEKFNASLKEEGLDQAMAYRKLQKEENKTVTEHYQRSVKTIFQVGGQLSDLVTRPTSLPLDIVPLENPYSIPDLYKTSALKVSFRVFFKNHPLDNALVKIWYQEKGRGVTMDSLRTSKRGTITTERHPGPFMLSCVYMDHTLLPGRETEWQSYWASLSFEYSQFFSGGGH